MGSKDFYEGENERESDHDSSNISKTIKSRNTSKVVFLTTSVVQPHPITCDAATSQTVTSAQASPNSEEREEDLSEEASGSNLAFVDWDTPQKTSRAIVGSVLLRNS